MYYRWYSVITEAIRIGRLPREDIGEKPPPNRRSPVSPRHGISTQTSQAGGRHGSKNQK